MEYKTMCEPFDVDGRFITNAKALNDLDIRVNEAIKQGWAPLGGLACCITADGQGFVAQALIKND